MLKRFLLRTICSAALMAVPLLAQTSTKSHAANSDMEAWRSYKLTMPKVDEWAVSNRKLAAYMKAHPQFRMNKTDIGDAKSLTEMEKRARAEAPGAVQAIESSGLSFRDYWNVSAALMIAYVAAQYEKPGMPPPRDILPANINFVKANQQKIAQLYAEFGKLNARNKQ
ncbi:MAG TPA: hypothetical protein VF283_04435 [Bryobacteraceae bacterium]